MNIKPINYLKANADNLITEIGFEPLFVTQNGGDASCVRLVIQSTQAYKAQQEKMAFMELLTKSDNDINQGDVSSLDKFLGDL